MLSFDSVLQNSLAAATTKLDWIARINAALGPNRVVRCFRDADPTAANPFLTGVEFLNIGNTGTITGAGGNISSFGKVAGATIRKAADLATGASILRIEGNGHWVQGTLGLKAQNLDTDTTNDHDFIMNTNPTAKAGFGMRAGMKSPPMLPSGTGPLAPDLDSDRPVYVELVDWRNQSAPVVVKTSVLSVRDENMTLEDADLAAEFGDIRITFLDETIVYDGFEFGAMLMSCNPVVNGDNSKVLHQVLISCKPHNTWPSYPAMDTYNQHDVFNIVKKSAVSAMTLDVTVNNASSILEDITLTAIDANNWTVSSSVRGNLPNISVPPKDDMGYYDSVGNVTTGAPANWTFWCRPSYAAGVAAGDTFTFSVRHTYDATKPRDITTPSPFKINLKKIDGTILYTYQMHDGLPINSPLLAQVRQPSAGLRPKFNCAMMLPWSSSHPKLNTKRLNYGLKAGLDVFRASQARQGYSANAAIPMIYGRTQINSANHYIAAPRWPVGYANSPENDALDPNIGDTYVFDVKSYFSAGGVGAFMSRAVGWDYEPGSISLHDWYTGPGGPRFDRCPIPSPIVTYMNLPNGTRLRDGASHRDLVDAWNYAYFNHSNHYMLNVKDFTTISTKEVNAGGWSYSRAYYGGTDNYVPGGLARHIAQWAIPNGASGGVKLDRNGQPIWNGWALDMLHNYAQPAWVALLFNSPMHIIAARHRYNAGMMAQLGGVGPTVTSGYLERNGAWRWLHWALMWKIGTGHRLGVAREDIAARWQKDMEIIHDVYVVPATDPTHPDYNSMTSVALRGLGQRVKYVEDNGYKGQCLQHNCLAYYMTQVFILMKTSGSWDAMYNRSPKCKKTLDFTMRCYDIFSVDFMLDAKGRAEGDYPYVSSKVLMAAATPTDVATSWADWATKFPAVGQEDWVHGVNGTIYNTDGSPRGERENAAHLRANWVFMRKVFFPEFVFPRMDEAIAAYQAHYDERATIIQQKIAAGAGTAEIRNIDWPGRIPGFFTAQAVS